MEGPAGWRHPPPLALLLISCTALLAAASVFALGLALHPLARRLTRSHGVAALLGPVAILALAPAWAGFTRAGAWQLAAGLAAAGLLSLSGALLAGAAEARGRPVVPLATWAGAGLLLAGVARLLAAGLPAAGWPPRVAVSVGLLLAAAGLAGLRLRRRRPLPSLPRLLALLAAAALAGAFSPWLLPWLLFDRDLPGVHPWPPNLLFVSLDAPWSPGEPDREQALRSVELLAVEAVAYEVHPRPPLAALLRLPDGSPLERALEATGYATAAIVTDPTRPPKVATEHYDARPGGRRLLESSAAWMVGARFLVGPGSALASLVGQGRDLRSPRQIGAEASRWLLGWRTRRAPTPFFLLVDLRAPGADASSLDAALTQLLDTLWELELDRTTMLVLAIEGREPHAGGHAGQALLVPPKSWPPLPERGRGVPHRIRGAELGFALLQLVRSDGTGPLTLPGLSGRIAPPPRELR